MGNPTVDEITSFKSTYHDDDFIEANSLSSQPIIALLSGSRKQEIKDNLPIMLNAASSFPGYQLVLAGAPGISPDYYQQYIQGVPVKIVFGKTYELLSHARAALVTSGTATLETALFKVPQVVCYHTPMGKMYSFLKKHFLLVKYVSLVNLIVDREIVSELVADKMKLTYVQNELGKILSDIPERDQMLKDYDEMINILGPAGASQNAAQQMVSLLQDRLK